MFIASIGILFIISFLLALISLKRELKKLAPHRKKHVLIPEQEHYIND